MRKADVRLTYHRDMAEGSPMLDVKVRGQFGPPVSLIRERFKCSEAVAEQALAYAFESSAEMFWEDAQENAAHIFGPRAKVWSAGRSGGWLVVEGLPPVESWDAVQLGKWARFAKDVAADIEYRCTYDPVLEDIEANRWAEPGAKRYNFFGGPGGVTVCSADLYRVKEEAAAAYLESLKPAEASHE